MNRYAGFTLIELITTLVILSVLSAVAIPKFSDANAYAERAFFDDVLHALQYAQKLAIATGCDVQVSIVSNSYSLTRRGTSSSTGCSGSLYSLAVTHPGTGASSYSGSEQGVTLTSSLAIFSFNALGSASSNVTLTVNGTRAINVIAETGFVL